MSTTRWQIWGGPAEEITETSVFPASHHTNCSPEQLKGLIYTVYDEPMRLLHEWDEPGEIDPSDAENKHTASAFAYAERWLENFMSQEESSS